MVKNTKDLLFCKLRQLVYHNQKEISILKVIWSMKISLEVDGLTE